MTNEIIPKSGEICTYSGRSIEPLNPRAEDVAIEDIAHALANSCRFTGHVRHFYSVAQHSVLVAELVPNEDKLWGLLHDASEAYLSDMARPIKHQPGFGDVYRAAESRLMNAICEKFNLPPDMPASVREADEILLANEIRQLMPEHPMYDQWKDHPEIRTGALNYKAPAIAKELFLYNFTRLGGESSE